MNTYFLAGPRLEPDGVAFFCEPSALMETDKQLRQIDAVNWCLDSHLYRSVASVREISGDHGSNFRGQGVVILLLLLSGFARGRLGSRTR